jgi:hypothetical protein
MYKKFVLLFVVLSLSCFTFAQENSAPPAGTKIFVSDSQNKVVNIYNPSGKQLTQLTGFNSPEGLAIDVQGKLYVADFVNSQILVYAPPYTKTPKKLSVPGFSPLGVAVTTIAGTTYVGVANYCSTSSCGQGSVIVYKNGKAQKPILSSAIFNAYFLGFDAKGNLFADGLDGNHNFVVGEIAKATSGGKTFKALTSGNSISFPGGVQVTSKGKIAIGDQFADLIFTYNPPKKGALGNPIRTTPLNDSVQAVSFAFTSTDKGVWTSDRTGAALKFAYPAGGSALTTIVVDGTPIGIAVFPAQP